jgi:hypothetical protein
MATWLLDHDTMIQLLAAGTLLGVCAAAYWWSKPRHSLHELGTMSVKWLSDKRIFRYRDHH